MHRLGLGCILFVPVLAGCTTTRFLDRNVVRQSSSLTDLMYQQVLDNVALFVNRRGTLPHIAVIGDGTAQAQDSGTGGATFNWNASSFTGASLPLSASRQLMENWKLQPVMTAGRLRRLRCAFQFVFGAPVIAIRQAPKAKRTDPAEVVVPEGCVKCVDEFVQVGILPAPCPHPDASPCPKKTPCCVKDEQRDTWKFENWDEAMKYRDELIRAIECNFPTNWFVVGAKKDAPTHGCLVGSYCDTYAWLRPGGDEALARFTITILALATLDPPSQTVEKTSTRPMNQAAYRAAIADFLGALMVYQPEIEDALEKKTAEAAQNERQRAALLKSGTMLGTLQKGLEAYEPELNTNILNNKLLGISAFRHVILSLNRELPPPLVVLLDRKAARAEQEIVKLMAPPETTTVYVPEVQGAFSRPGSSPLSRGASGLEFTPSVPTP